MLEVGVQGGLVSVQKLLEHLPDLLVPTGADDECGLHCEHSVWVEIIKNRFQPPAIKGSEVGFYCVNQSLPVHHRKAPATTRARAAVPCITAVVRGSSWMSFSTNAPAICVKASYLYVRILTVVADPSLRYNRLTRTI